MIPLGVTEDMEKALQGSKWRLLNEGRDAWADYYEAVMAQMVEEIIATLS